jgi:hypothetical protein
MSFSVKYTMDGLIERLQATRDAIPEIMSEAVKEIESLAVIALEDACPVDDDENNGTLSGEEGHLVHSFVALDPEASGAKVTGKSQRLSQLNFSMLHKEQLVLSFQRKSMLYGGRALLIR